MSLGALQRRAATVDQILGKKDHAVLPHKFNHAEELAFWEGAYCAYAEATAQPGNVDKFRAEAALRLTKLRMVEKSLPKIPCLHEDVEDYKHD